ncbi:phage major capsid protein [Lactiplantibacillus plantarum]|uniref:phage major capsid protein n=2 Tax=Lactobacillaceae TaxID=33958 RepID=UPI0021A8D007|nr:phage major capsid protein [Lactiplantibacillus plantarum]
MIQNNEKLIIKSSEIRAVEPTDDNNDPTGKQLEGYALMFNSPSKDLGKFIETIDPQALQDTDLSQVLFLNDHNFNQPIAKVGSGLTLDVDDKGLHFVVDIDDSVSYEADLYNLIQKGVVTSMSFGFELPDDGSGEAWTEDTATGVVTRTITYIQTLYEISAVSIPAYAASTVATRGYDSFINNNQKGEDTNMTKQTIINPAEQGELRSFEQYVRTHGETRDGLKTDGAQAVLPQEVVTPIFEGANAKQNLAEMATVKNVSTGSGKYPISISDPTKFLATKEELATIPDVDVSVNDVPFEAKSFAGKIFLSNELIDDSAIDIKAEVQAQLQQLVLNTDNHNVISLLQTLTSENAADIDGLKRIKNTEIDPAVLGSVGSVVITNQDGYNYLDTLKDSQGRYLLTEDVTAQSGKALFGLPVVVASNAVLPDVSGQFPVFIGNLPQAVVAFRRDNIAVSWQQFDSFSQGLGVIYRGDYRFIDKNAMKYALLGTPAGK